MTTISYADLRATSPGGRFVLTAQSPDNATTSHRSGLPPSGSELPFGRPVFQESFYYQLLEHVPGGVEPRVVWERWQKDGELSPHEVLVSDGGWSVIRTHGFDPEVIAVSPSGQDVLRVCIPGLRQEAEGDCLIWRPLHLMWTTAGTFWSGASWPYFFLDGGTDFFVWRTYWGQRLVLDLTRAALIPEQEAPVHVMDATEQREVSVLMTELTGRLKEVQAFFADPDAPQPIRPKALRAIAAIHLVGAHRIQACLPLLQEWESVDLPISSMSSTAFPGATIETQFFRPTVQHSMRLLGTEPRGLAPYRFLGARGSVPESVPDRRERARALKQNMRAQTVLLQMGNPDCVFKQSRKVDGDTLSTETWEYDFLVDRQWKTLQLVWEERRSRSRITHMEEMPAPWLQSDARVRELLQYL
ncbi:hypothetical protein HPP05_02285 [Corallococcus exiguus]|uniref:hypothetical protein n=1 Tax=Corallococcus exiguus TaxID=83462 RepID=UPI0014948945|nr:hypothetical protein [Corallococcus exiguus]NPC68573.1 hypothetical protein [Corallococcus exiguus]